MLARRGYSVAELRRALRKKFGEDASVAEAIARLRELRYLDDRKFAEQYASSLARNRAFGRHRIRRELRAKQVNPRYIEPAVARTFEETDEVALLEQVLAKKLRTVRLPLTLNKLHSLCQSLMRQGFPTDDIMKAVRARPELRPVAEDLDPEAISG